ncbi:MAG TPA: hypothetical protein VFS39_12195 [Nitrospira sp.]|nr:hypothetical protein [Nitrospira sp.]
MSFASCPTSSAALIILRGWIVLWMFAVPLLHVHPEVDHRHGEAQHLHGGTFHAVWAGDLDCESGLATPSSGGRSLLSGSHQTWHQHQEFGFSFVRDSADPGFFKGLLYPAAASISMETTCAYQAARTEGRSPPSSPDLTDDQPRAPPSLSA